MVGFTVSHEQIVNLMAQGKWDQVNKVKILNKFFYR